MISRHKLPGEERITNTVMRRKVILLFATCIAVAAAEAYFINANYQG